MATASAPPYDKKFFDRIGDSTLRSARIIAPKVLELTQATSIVDVGCGQGGWLQAFMDLGVEDVVGLDGDYDNNARQDSDLRNRMRLSGSRARCIWHRAIGVHLWHPEHKGRNEWSGADAYYHRKDLQPWAEHGLRELAAESGRSLPARNDD